MARPCIKKTNMLQISNFLYPIIFLCFLILIDCKNNICWILKTPLKTENNGRKWMMDDDNNLKIQTISYRHFQYMNLIKNVFLLTQITNYHMYLKTKILLILELKSTILEVYLPYSNSLASFVCFKNAMSFILLLKILLVWNISI